MVWDDGEVRKIICTAHWVLDRLGLMQAAKSLRSLVICFGVNEDDVLVCVCVCLHYLLHTCCIFLLGLF